MSLRARSGRSAVWLKKKRKAATALFMAAAFGLLDLEAPDILGGGGAG